MQDRICLTDILVKSDIRPMEKSIKVHTVNASDLGELCPRFHYFACQHKDQYLTSGIIDSALSVTFEMGRALETFVRKAFLEKISITKVLANWVIRDDIPIQREDMISDQWNHDLQKWEKCEFRLGHPHNTLADFREVRYSGLVTGRVDWMYLDNDNKITVCELKTISRDQFDSLKSPINKHIVQDLSYIRLAHEDQRIKTLGYFINFIGKVFYTCKDFRRRNEEDRASGANPMYKEFNIPFIEYKALMKERWDAAKEAVDAANTNTKPADRLCKSFLKGRGKSCPFSCRCFMGDE